MCVNEYKINVCVNDYHIAVAFQAMGSVENVCVFVCTSVRKCEFVIKKTQNKIHLQHEQIRAIGNNVQYIHFGNVIKEVKARTNEQHFEEQKHKALAREHAQNFLGRKKRISKKKKTNRFSLTGWMIYSNIYFSINLTF